MKTKKLFALLISAVIILSYFSFSITADDNKSLDVVENTLSMSIESDHKIVYDSEYEIYYIYPGRVNTEGSVKILAESSVQGADITYTWDKMPYYDYPTANVMPETLSNTTNTLNYTLTAGGLHYWCTVNDGTTSYFFDIQIIPDETIAMSNSVNGKTPTTYAGTYIFVTKPNEKVSIDVTSTSTFGNVKYTWFKQNQDDFSFSQLDHSTGVLEVTKSEPTDSDVFAVQPYECYIEDGNQKIRYQLLLFCLDPEASFSEIEKINAETPDVSFATDDENLANTLLSGEELKGITFGVSASIGLSAELKSTVDKDDQTAINSQLQENETVGMHLEMNLQKDINGDVTPITELENPIELNVKLPEGLVSTDDTVNRVYEVIRMHNGVAESIPAEFDSETKTLSFETDKFSLYTVTYTDSTEKQDNLDEKIPTSPKTNDSSDYCLWIYLMLINAMAVFCMTISNKKTNK